MLDSAVCSKARVARDARFDGRFFTAVLTTRIYCRPVCPARPPLEKNVRYYPTAAAAQEAGFRPCLRCRPEAAPGSPAWNGSTTTVSRALRLIADGALDSSSVGMLAERVGIGDRHLRRLFLEHLGATPVAVAQTRRLQQAKQLIDQTNLPFTEVALASGFGSLRRFNTAIMDTYQRTPTHIRNLRGNGTRNDDGALEFALPFRAPFDSTALLDFLRPRAVIEQIGERSWDRTFDLGNVSGHIAVEFAANAVRVRIRYPDVRRLFSILERVRRLFDLDADPAEIGRTLSADPQMAARLNLRPGLRVPGSWDPFETAARAIIGQQVSVKSATAVARRIATEVGMTAEAIASCASGQLRLPAARENALRELARRSLAGDVDLSSGADPDRLRSALIEIPGVGPWTAGYVAMRVSGDPDAFPTADLVLRKAAGNLSIRELERKSEAWRPWRAYAAMFLWQVPL